MLESITQIYTVIVGKVQSITRIIPRQEVIPVLFIFGMAIIAYTASAQLIGGGIPDAVVIAFVLCSGLILFDQVYSIVQQLIINVDFPTVLGVDDAYLALKIILQYGFTINLIFAFDSVILKIVFLLSALLMTGLAIIEDHYSLYRVALKLNIDTKPLVETDNLSVVSESPVDVKELEEITTMPIPDEGGLVLALKVTDNKTVFTTYRDKQAFIEEFPESYEEHTPQTISCRSCSCKTSITQKQVWNSYTQKLFGTIISVQSSVTIGICTDCRQDLFEELIHRESTPVDTEDVLVMNI